MDKLPSFPTNRIQPAIVILAIGLTLLSTGSFSFNSSMSAAPERSGAPPYDEDPEANGNPAKAWYN